MGDTVKVDDIQSRMKTIREDGRYQALRERYLKDLPDGSK